MSGVGFAFASCVGLSTVTPDIRGPENAQGDLNVEVGCVSKGTWRVEGRS